MDLQAQKEQFSLAYCRAVVATAGFGVYHPTPDQDQIDLGIFTDGDGGFMRSPRLEAQVKATSQDLLREDGVHFSLSSKHLDSLRKDRCYKALLIVVLVPEDVSGWLDQSPERLLLRRCAYWRSLLGHPGAEPGSASATVIVPRAQVFGPDQLIEIMRRLDQGGNP